MKNCLSVLFLLSSLTVFSQKNKVGLSFSTDAAFRVYESKMGSLGEIWGQDQEPKLGYTLTAHYERELTKKWSLTSGLLFTNKGYQTYKMDLRFSDQILPKQGFAMPTQEPGGPYAHRYRYSFYQIGVPLGIIYNMRLRKVNFFIGGGIATNYLINVRYTSIIYYTEAKNKVRQSNDDMMYYTRLSISAFTQGGIELNLPRNLKFRIAPNVSYSLTNVMDKKVIYKIYPYSIGIGYGVFWSF